MTTEDAVAKIAKVFGDAEAEALKIKAGMRANRKAFEAIRDEGVIGALECETLSGACDVLATRFEVDLFALHRALTVRAQELGIDLPQPRSGGR